MSYFNDVIKSHTLYHTAGRVADMNLLEPVMHDSIVSIIEDAKVLNVELMVFETFRSKERQAELFKQGATKLQTVGVHHYGLACDLVKSINGEPSWKGDFHFLGLLARRRGLIWGGDWGDPSRPHSFVDAVHVQRCSLKDQLALFRGDWYPDEVYNPYGGTIIS